MAELKKLKHERFALEYIQDYNATAAAIRAGYKESSARKTGSALMTNPDILARVHELQREMTKRLAISGDMVVLETMKTYLKCSAAVPCLRRNEKTGKWEEAGVYAYDSKGALKALDMLGKFTGAYDTKPPSDNSQNNILEQIKAATGTEVNTDDIPELH